jgi:hypothetical protein
MAPSLPRMLAGQLTNCYGVTGRLVAGGFFSGVNFHINGFTFYLEMFTFYFAQILSILGELLSKLADLLSFCSQVQTIV